MLLPLLLLLLHANYRLLSWVFLFLDEVPIVFLASIIVLGILMPLSPCNQYMTARRLSASALKLETVTREFLVL